MSRVLQNGIENYISVASSATVNNLTALTIMSWVKLASYGTFGDTTLFSKGIGGAIFNDFDITDHVSYGNTYFGFINYGGGTNSSFSTDDDLVSLGVWTHLALTYDEAGDRKCHVWVNAVEVGSYVSQVASIGTLLDDSSAPWIVGSYPSVLVAGVLAVDGKLFDARIYNAALSQANIAVIVGSGPTVDPQPTQLKCQLTFATDQGSPEPDASGNSNTGAITGATFSSDNPSFVPPPTVLSINPASANQGVTNKRVTVTGTDFDLATAVLTFSGAGVTVAGYESKSATQIIAFVDITAVAGATARDVIVTNGDAQSDTLSAAFTVVTFTPGGDSGPTYRTERNPRVPRRGMV